MGKCCVPHCRIRKEKGCGVSFHHFPVDSELIDKWLKAIFRQSYNDWTPTKNSLICSKHFRETDYSASTHRKILLPSSVPSVFSNYPENSEIQEETPEEIPSGKKKRKVWLETETIKQELGKTYLNEVVQATSVKDEIEIDSEEMIEQVICDKHPLEQTEYIPDTGAEYMKCEEFETAHLGSFCRLCASQSEDVISVFENFKANCILLEKIHTYLPIMMTADDVLPTTVCLQCVNKLEICHSLIQGCIDADAVLKTIFGFEKSSQNREMLEEGAVCEENQTDNSGVDVHDEPEDENSAYLDTCFINAVGSDIEIDETALLKKFLKKKSKLKNQIWKEGVKPKFNVVIVKVKNVNDKVELQKTLQQAINKKMKTQIPELNEEPKLSESPANESDDPDVEVSRVKDGEQSSVKNQDEIVSDHTYTLKALCQHCQQIFTNKEELALHQQTSEECGNNLLHESTNALDEQSNNENQPEDEENLEVTNSSNSNKENMQQKDIGGGVGDLNIKTNKKPGTFKLDRGCHIKFPKGFEHISTMHQAKILTAINKIIEKKKTKETKPEYVKCPDGWKCQECELIFPTLKAFRIHRQTHTAKPFPCTKCKRKFISEKNLHHHLNLHENGKDCSCMCEYCGKICRSKESLKLHYFTHGKSDTIHKCNECGKTFGSRANFKQHLICHRKASYLCDICGKSMKYASSLRIHKAIHKQKFIFECTTCGKIYNSREGLRRHTWKHLGKKPFACDKCDKHFETLLDLSEHKLVHASTELHRCHICDKSFSLRSQLKKHIARHQVTSKYTCRLCQFTFRSLKELLIHRRNHSTTEVANLESDETTLTETVS